MELLRTAEIYLKPRLTNWEDNDTRAEEKHSQRESYQCTKKPEPKQNAE